VERVAVKRILCVATFITIVGLASEFSLEATVAYATKEKKPCTTCHVKMGAADLNAAGKYYAQHKTLVGYAAAPPKSPAAPAKPTPPPEAVPAPPPTPALPPATPGAPTAPERHLLLVVREKVDPPQFLAYEEAVKAWVRAAKEAKLGGEFSWQAVQRDPFTFSFLWPIGDLNELDPASSAAMARKQKVAAVLGAERIQELEAQGAGATRAGESWIVESVPELSYVPAKSTGGIPTVVHVDREQVRFDRVPEYEAVIKRIMEQLGKAEFPFPLTGYRNLTGPANTYYFVLSASDRTGLAELERFFEETLPKLAGEEAARKLFAEWTACLVDFEHFDETIRQDLSYTPEPGSKP
jgi:hypothetical protein